MDFDLVLQSFSQLHATYGSMLNGLLLLFFRVLAFLFFGPIFNRKNIPAMLKISAAIFFTGALISHIPAAEANLYANEYTGFFILQLIMNITIGALIGFIANMILQVVYSAGNLMNNQIGLSSAMIMDPSSGRQTMILESLFAFLTLAAFMELGGLHWMILALEKSLRLFPLFQIQHNIPAIISMDYLNMLSGNVISVAVTMMAPILVVTLCVDIMLGIVNRTAQQMPVFQLSFALKPSVGVAVLLVTLPIFINVLLDFLNDYAGVF